MPDLIRVEYAQDGSSKHTNALGMREMQARAFEARDKQYLLLKAPPASGKSRSLMFLALDKLVNQGLSKAIVAVPETAIGASFQDAALTEYGFFADWVVRPEHNLCTPGNEGSAGKIEALKAFIRQPATEIADRTLVCTHATLRFAFEKMAVSEFDNTLLAIDEFHHASADEGNKLGTLLDTLMHKTSAHVVAMTGSYFRGDTVPILLPEDEALFDKVTYTYYEQLNGYEHLKSLGIGYHFYQGRYTDALREVLDPRKKTIVHIPHPASRESTKDKYGEVDHIIDALGGTPQYEAGTGMITADIGGQTLRIADLVTDSPEREKVKEYLRTAQDRDDVDIIIALGMAKEGFDWPWCEHVLTIGYRNSMTEVIQIIGRATRDAPGKTHAQFTNLIAQPDAEDEDVKFAVNNMLKAITVSLLMEQVMAPTFNFRPRYPGGEPSQTTTIDVTGVGGEVSPKVQGALDASDEIIAEYIQQPEAAGAVVGSTDAEVMTEVVLPRVIRDQHPNLTDEEIEQVRQGVATQMALVPDKGRIYNEDELPDNANVDDGQKDPENPPTPGPTIVPGVRPGESDDPDTASGGKQFVRLGDKFVNIENLHMDLIDRVNPFQGAYEILSKSVTAPVLKTIQDEVFADRSAMTEEEALVLYPRIKAFYQEYGREPSVNAADLMEKRYAEALAWIRRKKREAAREAQGAG